MALLSHCVELEQEMNASIAANDTHCTFKMDFTQSDSQLRLGRFGDSKQFHKCASVAHLLASNN